MQNKKQIMPMAALHFLLGAALSVVIIIALIMDIDGGIFEADAFSIIITFASLIGTIFVFAIPSFALGAYFMDMGSEKQMHTAIRYSVSGWTIMFMYSTAYFIYWLAEVGEFYFEVFLPVLLSLLPLVITSVLYKKKDAYGMDLNGAKIASVLYFAYLGLFNTIYKIARDLIGSTALSIISFILSSIMGLTITLSFCYFYFKLEGKAVREGAPAAYGQPQYGPQPYGQPQYGQPQYGPQQPQYGPQQPQYGPQQQPYAQPQQYQQNPYGAPDAPVPPVQQAPVQQQAPLAKFCPACGGQNPVESGFCRNCGNQLP